MINDLSFSSAGDLWLEIRNSTFNNNKAKTDAGVLYSYYSNVFIENSNFSYNEAVTGDAGALYLECPFSKTCAYSVKDSNFTWNKAKVNGGAIKFTS